MIDNKTQDEINQTEWENPDNWTTIYFSKKDSRPWVPKKIPGTDGQLTLVALPVHRGFTIFLFYFYFLEFFSVQFLPLL